MLDRRREKIPPYDLVLMDWQMPGMDGIETVQRLQEECLSNTPAVIMVTAYGREEALAVAERRHVQLRSALAKPVTSSNAAEAIGEVSHKGQVIETRGQQKRTRIARPWRACAVHGCCWSRTTR